MNEKNKIEALLFASGRKMGINEIAQITGISDIELIKQALNELKAEYESRGSSVTLFAEGDGWKLNVKEHYLPLVQKIVTQTEMNRPLIETLSVIAWKFPVLQSTVIRIRHNKAYEHLKQLEEIGFITKTKAGRTSRIGLTQKFFDYFDLPSREEVQKAFKDVVPEDVKQKVEAIEREIEEGEKKAIQVQEKIKAMEEEKRAEKESAANENQAGQ